MHAAPRRWKRVMVVTSEFHMGRTRAAFEWVWGLADAPTGPVELVFAATEDTGLDADTIEVRGKREAESERQLRANAERLTDMPSFCDWLFETHKCYAVKRQHEIGDFSEMANDPALKSY